MSWNKVEKDVTRSPLGALKWFVILILTLFVFFGILNAIGLIGGKAVERVVLKNSFQYKEGMSQRGAILEANIAEVDYLIQSQPERRQELNAQKKYMQAQLKAISINN